MSDNFDKDREALGVDVVDDFLAKFGLGPKYKPTPVKTCQCPVCQQHNAYYKEMHADCDSGQNEFVLYCPNCKGR